MTILVTRRNVLLGLGTTALLAHPALSWAQEHPNVVVTKDPTCGCCTGWADHMRAAGFSVQVVETQDINRVKARLGVPKDLASCHTAEVSGYILEGHVPAAEVKRLLAERPQAKGLAVLGMPMGSPGMEMDGMEDAYEVILFGPAIGSTQAALRAAHLRYHLSVLDVVTSHQVRRYQELRGYAGQHGRSGSRH